MRGVFQAGMGLFKTATGSTQKAEAYTRATRTSPADVVSFFNHFALLRHKRGYQISWSGCKDSQTSADTVEAGAATGAMSYVSHCCVFTPIQSMLIFAPAPGLH